MLTFAELLLERLDVRWPVAEGVEVVAQPHCHHASVLGWADRRLLERRRDGSPRSRAAAAWRGTSGWKGHYDVSVVIAETHLLPAVRSQPTAAVPPPTGMSCRVQLDDLAGVPDAPGRAARLWLGVKPRHRQLVIPIALVAHPAHRRDRERWR